MILFSCRKPLNLIIKCNGSKIGAVLDLSLSATERKIQGKQFRGAHMSVGLKLKNKALLDECCPKRTWRQWTKSTKAYNKPSPLGSVLITPNKWNVDFNPKNASSNLPSRKPDLTFSKEQQFDLIFRDSPMVTIKDVTVEFITCYGCVESDGVTFKPLGCFTWSYEVESDGDIEVDGFKNLDLKKLKTMNLPQNKNPQIIPKEPL